MKKLFIFVALLMVLVPSVTVGRTVNLPNIDTNFSKNLLIRSVELTDTATRVNLSMLYLPESNQWRDSLVIIGKATGQTYPLIRSEGYEVGTAKLIGPSGRFDHVYVYPPLDPADTLVNLQPAVFKNGAPSDLAFGIHLGANEPGNKYTANLRGHHSGMSGFVYITECSARNSNLVKIIPVDNGEFSATFSTDRPVFFALTDGLKTLENDELACKFIPEGDDLDFEIHTGEDNPADVITVMAPSASSTHTYNDYWKQVLELWNNSPAVMRRDSLKQARAYYLPKYYELKDLERKYPEKKDSIKNEWQNFWKLNTVRTPEGEAAEIAIKDFLDHEIYEATLQSIRSMKNSAGLFALIEKVWMADDASDYLDIYRRVYRDQFPDHPYSKELEEMDGTFEPLPGNPYNDFTAIGFDGKEYRLSELVDGHPAVIDLWASWCGPCRAASKSLIPVYNDYSSKGFTIVGVARETGIPDFAKKVIDSNGYPWLNLLELDDKAGIWALYRRQNAAGGIFLIDAEGKIVAVDPTADEIRKYLEQTLK